jgi:hypothetical protein
MIFVSKSPLFAEVSRLGALYIKAKYRERQYKKISDQISDKIKQIILQINKGRDKPITSWKITEIPDVEKDKTIFNQTIRYVPKGTREDTTEWGKEALKLMLKYYAVDPDIVSTQLEYIEEQQLPTLLDRNNIDVATYKRIIQLKTPEARKRQLEELLISIPEKERQILITISNFGPILKKILQQIMDKQPVKDLAFQIKDRKDYISWKEK